MPSLVLGSVQPAYMAWVPFYQRMIESDVFVYLDDVEFSKNSFHNRNKIKTAQGPVYLTVPIQYKGNSNSSIKEMPIDNKKPWRKKHWQTILQNYSKAPFFPDLGPLLKEQIYDCEWIYLGDLNVTLLELFREFLKINTPCYQSSKLTVIGESNEKLVNLCHKLGAELFIVKPATDHYHPKTFFESHKIGFKYFNQNLMPYPQLHGSFIPGLSILDYAMNCGPNCNLLMKT